MKNENVTRAVVFDALKEALRLTGEKWVYTGAVCWLIFNQADEEQRLTVATFLQGMADASDIKTKLGPGGPMFRLKKKDRQ